MCQPVEVCLEGGKGIRKHTEILVITYQFYIQLQRSLKLVRSINKDPLPSHSFSSEFTDFLSIN